GRDGVWRTSSRYSRNVPRHRFDSRAARSSRINCSKEGLSMDVSSSRLARVMFRCSGAGAIRPSTDYGRERVETKHRRATGHAALALRWLEEASGMPYLSCSGPWRDDRPHVLRSALERRVAGRTVQRIRCLAALRHSRLPHPPQTIDRTPSGRPYTQSVIEGTAWLVRCQVYQKKGETVRCCDDVSDHVSTETGVVPG